VGFQCKGCDERPDAIIIKPLLVIALTAHREFLVDIFKSISFWFVVAVVVVILPIVGAIIAENKGRNARGWFLGCLLFPMSGILILLVLPPLKPRPGAATRPDGAVEAKDVDAH
jgi:hypothetical protein